MNAGDQTTTNTHIQTQTQTQTQTQENTMETNAFRRPARTRIRRLAPVMAIVAGGVLLAGCTAAGTGLVQAASETGSSGATSSTASAAVSTTLEELASANQDGTVVREDEWSIDDAIDVTLSGSAATADSGVSSADGVVTITEAGVYRLSGSLDGRIVVAAADDAQVVLVLDDASITSGDGPAIEVQTADDVAVHLADGSQSTIVDTSAYGDDADANAAIFSEQDLTISGAGSLSVAASNDGITSEDDLAIIGGTIDVVAADEALRGKDSIQVEGGTLTLEAGGDALQSDNTDEADRGWIRVEGGTISAAAGDDGFDAATDLLISGGTISVDVAGDGLHGDVALAIADGTVTVAGSNEGLESALVQIDGGVIDVTAVDDGINGASGGGGQPGAEGEIDSGELIAITGGSLTLHTDSDGIDSNGSIEISGGEIVVWGPTTEREGALDANVDITISGGTVLAVGASGMAQAPSDTSSQPWLQGLATGEEGSTIEIRGTDGEVLATYAAESAFSNVVFSSAELSGDSATVMVDGVETEVELGVAVGASMGGPGGAADGGMGGPGGAGGMPPARP
ncbi:carbohydrate-binding domain-containing protein [Agrococcus sp. ProA11]|uniref:carbohydrate-binding domain-containing protein n=1 Tax=Agrococcus chionoecetis TaxID=3153752 RepID=UPI00325FE0AA